MQTRGFTLVEVVVAMAVLTTASIGGAHLLAFGTRAMHVARLQGTCALAAAARLDELRSLRFEFDAEGQRLTDVSTNLAVSPPDARGGGLTPGGAPGLDGNIGGFVDFLDASGAWVGTGPVPPPNAAFVRRWVIDPAGSPDLLVLQVLVRPVVGSPGEARYATVLARVQR